VRQSGADLVAVRHVPDEQRFVADVVGGEAEIAYTGPRDGVVALVHTEVPEESRGAGVGEAIASEALGWARASGLKVRPLCPFVAAFIRRHPEYQDLVA